MSKTANHTSALVITPLPPFAVDERRACLGADPNLFFPERGSNGMQAKDICRTCMFVAPCREYALSLPLLDGVWGATSHDDRQAMRVRAARKAGGQR